MLNHLYFNIKFKLKLLMILGKLSQIQEEKMLEFMLKHVGGSVCLWGINTFKEL